MENFISLSGWIFGLVSCVCAIIQTISKKKYKNQYLNAKAKNNSSVIQIGELNGKRNES